MKRFILAVVFVCLIVAGPAWAAGTVVVGVESIAFGGGQLVLKLTCTGDADNGTVPARLITDAMVPKNTLGLRAQYYQMGYYLYDVTVEVGDPAPDAADITITDAIGDVLFSEANVIPASGTKSGTIAKYKAITSQLTVTQANQATASAVWYVYLTFVK